MITPISSFETDIKIEEEILTTSKISNVTSEQIIELNNVGNIRKPVSIKITAKGNISNIVVENQTGDFSITYSGSLVDTDILLLANDMGTKNGVDVDCVFAAPFFLLENQINSIKVTYTGATKPDIEFTWLYPSGSLRSLFYVNDFRVSESRDFVRKRDGFKSPYSNGASAKSVSATFSIGRLWGESFTFNDDPNTSYRLIYITDQDVLQIEQQVYILCGCHIENKELAHQNGQIVVENLSGFADKMIKMPYGQAEKYYLTPYQLGVADPYYVLPFQTMGM